MHGRTYRFRAFIVLNVTCVATGLLACAQSLPSEPAPQTPRSDFLHDSPKTQYKLITSGERLRWFVRSTAGPAHIAGVAFVSAGGTAVNRPGEYGPHWDGSAKRLGIAMASSAVGNAMEASAGIALREDPRYFPVPLQPFKARVQNVFRLTFSARADDERLKPAYARYIGIVGGNFLSNAWRVHSEANVHDALIRSSEGFGGRTAANAFTEFWPDVKRYVFRSRNRMAGPAENTN